MLQHKSFLMSLLERRVIPLTSFCGERLLWSLKNVQSQATSEPINIALGNID